MQSCGNWNNGGNAGLSARNFNNNRTNSNNNTGFRGGDYLSSPDTTEVETGNIGISTPASAKYADNETTSYSHVTLEQIADMDLLYIAFKNASKGKRFKKSIHDFENNIAQELIALRDEILSGTYHPQEPKTFTIYEPKQREIAAPAFRDSVVQHAIYMLIYPMFDRGFIHDSYGCRIGKGTHRAADKLQEQMRQCSGEEYFLQIDIRKYYYSIDHAVLRNQMAKKIYDPRVLDLVMSFVGHGDKGLHIGSLLSQFFGLVYLDQFDHWIKRHLKIKHYVRYVDDSVLTGLSSREEAKDVLKKIVSWLKERLKLVLSKWKIQKIKRGVNFVGFRTWRSTRFLRKRSLYNFSKALKRVKVESLMSIVGNAKRTATFGYFIQQLERKKNDLQIQKVYRRFA
ncbi:reverse transcriptase/maturase family protein [Sulfurovum mangrovi]|uniref:reverse transcriptase/maturase family protein n=1 Tax=Sulfurovum mangrovi TaxID=2893889 RepID=UPI001E2E859D|nr:reverse transcriptase/maturase family protein [Sulfurovum mangrovi]UFH59846.1 reverse transcriptase/maturase family protein [Sulfurovum mangrovi]UFH59897.1 reverse transcriptase/maturase family protein [Sulfurovum mangrovi]